MDRSPSQEQVDVVGSVSPASRSRRTGSEQRWERPSLLGPRPRQDRYRGEREREGRPATSTERGSTVRRRDRALVSFSLRGTLVPRSELAPTPAGCSVAVQADPLVVSQCSVSTDTTDPFLEPTVVSVGTGVDQDPQLHPVILRDMGCNTDPVGVRPGTPVPDRDSTVDPVDDEAGELEEVPPPEGVNVLSSEESPDEDRTFKDIVCFLREFHSLGPMKEVPSKVLGSAWAKAARQIPPPGLSYELPLSPLAMSLREQANVLLQSMGEKRVFSFIQPPSARDYRWYRPDGTSFVAPFEIHPRWSRSPLCRSQS